MNNYSCNRSIFFIIKCSVDIKVIFLAHLAKGNVSF
jgi:hypothetical protein